MTPEPVTWRSMPMEELRRRVKEAEGLLGVARGLAKDELNDPQQCERARDRIESILREIDALFPGLNEPATIDPADLVAPSMRDRVQSAEASADADDEPAGGGEAETGEEEETDEEGGEDDEDEWEWDLDKLAAAIENEELMSKIPEADRAWFKRVAKIPIESRERVELCERVLAGFEELTETMRRGLDQASKQLAVALTLEELKAKQRQ